MSKHYPAGLLCFAGIILHILLSDPLLHVLGVHYSGEEGYFYEKIHPGTILILIAFYIWLARGFTPVENTIALYRQHKAFCVLLVLYVILFFYMAARSGLAGLAFIIDTHMTSVLCAIMFTYAPPSLCRKLVHFLILAVAVNGMAGITEAMYKFRIFTFDSDWPVLHERYFRASAFIGHPLDNAIFTSVALFVLQALDYPKWLKVIISLIYIAALVAFGGRMGIIVSLAGLLMIAGFHARRLFNSRVLTSRQITAIAVMIIAVPVCFAGIFALVLYTPIGERLASSASWDSSANSRLVAFKAFSYMKTDDVLFGMPGERIRNTSYRMSLSLPITDIENPWILMFMYLGAVTFPFWLAATVWFMYRLGKNQPPALQLAILAYFLIASTSNTFGRKDANYAIMVSGVVCAARMLSRAGSDDALPAG